MTFFTGNYLIDIVAVIASICAAIYAYSYWNYQMWQRKGVPNFEPRFPFGNIQKVHSVTIGDDITNIARKAKEEGEL